VGVGTYYVFDLMHLDGRDLTGLPLAERKALLAPLTAGEVDSLFSEQCRLSGEVPDPVRQQPCGADPTRSYQPSGCHTR
jgi:ATP-dependent DNA ligase